MYVIAPAIRLATARRAYARRSCACAFVHRKSRNSVGRRTAREQERGGVSPPWFRYRVCTGVRQHTVGSLPRLCESVLANAPAEPRRAHARCSWLAHGDRVRTCAELSSHERFPHHGGLTPPTPGVTRATSSRDGVQTCRYKCGCRTTAGSRPRSWACALVHRMRAGRV